MSWIDVAILALVVLVGLLGLWRGAKKSLLSLGAFLISFLMAILLANVIAEAFLGVDSIKLFVLGNGVGEKSQWSLAKMIYDGLGDSFSSDKSSFLGKNFFAPILNVTTSVSTALKDVSGIDTTKAGFAICGAFMIFSSICGVGIFFVIRLLLMILTFVIKTMFIGKVKQKALSRLIGFFVGALTGFLWMFAFTIVFSTLGGYTFLSGINAIEKEYEENAVVCDTVNEWGYGLRNNLLLPDGDMYGRLVDMVYKKKNEEIVDSEHLAPVELRLFVGISNLGYDGSPYGIDDLKRRTFDMSDPSIHVRRATEFGDTGFYEVVKAILDYNKSIADKIDAQTTGLNQDVFGTLANIVTGEGMDNISKLMDDLWAKLRKYEYDFANPEEGAVDTVINSTLSADYNAVVEAINALATKYELFAEAFGEFPDVELPEQKHAGDPPSELPEDAEDEDDGIPEDEDEDDEDDDDENGSDGDDED